VPYDRLGALDASFLHMETPETPMHVGAVSVFEGGAFRNPDGTFRIDEVRRLVASRLHLIPRFRKRLMWVPLQQGRPVWVDDPAFDLEYHVRLTALPRPGRFDQLLTLTSRVQEQVLDRHRPLWELWFVEGLEGDRVGLIQKTHHALVDGVSGVDVATLLLDLDPQYRSPDVPDWLPEPAPSESELVIGSLWERATQPAELARSLRAALRRPRQAASRFSHLAGSVGSLVGTETVAPRTSLNGPVSRQRRFATVRLPLDDVKRIRKSLGGTVNDAVLTAVGAAFGELLRQRGEDTADLKLRVMCPVSVRADHERNSFGNRVSAMFVSIPVDERLDPATRLAAVQQVTADLKEREQAVGAEMLTELTEYLAPTLLALAGRVAHRQPFFNFVCTNVPGPQFPLYLMGARLLEAYPIVPLVANTTLVVGVLSYDGAMHFGLFGDRDAAPDLDALAGALRDAFDDLLALAG
jgi:diacylglycerol O-acyltransferase